MNLKKIALLGGVGLASAAAGVVLPQVLSGGPAKESVEPAAGHNSHADAGSHDKPAVANKAAKPAAKKEDHAKKNDHAKKEDHGKKDTQGATHAKGDEGVVHDGPCFVPFGLIVANVNEPLLAKYLTLEITVQTAPEDKEEVESAITSRKPFLLTWLAAHIADKTPEDIRGKVGVNRLRREIQDNFNSLMFKDGHERVQDILFEEYHVQ